MGQAISMDFLYMSVNKTKNGENTQKCILVSRNFLNVRIKSANMVLHFLSKVTTTVRYAMTGKYQRVWTPNKTVEISATTYHLAYPHKNYHHFNNQNFEWKNKVNKCLITNTT